MDETRGVRMKTQKSLIGKPHEKIVQRSRGCRWQS